MMSPTPEANRDTPKRNEEDQEISMPDAPQFIASDAGNSDEEDEDESHIDLTNGGYQMLAQEPGTLSSDEEDEVDNDETDNDGQTVIDIPETNSELSPTGLAQPAVQVPHIDPPEVQERQEVWKEPATNHTPMDQEQAEKIKNVMKNIKLPQMNIPSWARLVPEEEWKSQLVDKVTPKDSASSLKK